MSDTTHSNRVAIVTGGARRIGAEIARCLHQRGLRVCLHYRSSNADAEALIGALNQVRPESACGVVAELSDAAAPARIRDAALQAFGRIDVLINNASAFYPTPIAEATQTQWDELMASNLRGPFFLSQACAPALSEAGGAIVNLVDIHAEVPLAQHPIYCMAKAGLVMQTRSLAKDLAPAVRVNAVAPGSILWPEGDAADTPEAQAAILACVPMRRQGEPADIANMVTFLALDAPYVTGQVVAVDGGRSLHR